MEIVIASCIDQGLEMSYEPLLKSGKPPRHVWLLPTLLIGPVLILCAHRIHKQQDFRGSCGRSLPLHSCHRVDRSLQIALIQVREEPDGPSSPSRAKVGPLFCRVGAVVSCPRSPCAWTKPKEQQGDGQVGLLPARTVLNTAPSSGQNPPHVTDGHTEASLGGSAGL